MQQQQFVLKDRFLTNYSRFVFICINAVSDSD